MRKIEQLCFNIISKIHELIFVREKSYQWASEHPHLYWFMADTEYDYYEGYKWYIIKVRRKEV